MCSSYRLPITLLGLLLTLATSLRAEPLYPHAKPLPPGTLIVKGAWSSASDSTTPVPEGGKVVNNVYSNPYLGLSYPLPRHWATTYDGPPPSDSGYYVLAQLGPEDSYKDKQRGTLLIAAHDMFFASTAGSARELIHSMRHNLQKDYQVEHPPTEVKIGGHSFMRLGYMSPVAGLHWYILATQIRCHVVQFIVTSPDTGLIVSLVREMDAMKLPAGADLASGKGGGDVPVCIKGYANDSNVLSKVDAVLSERRFNAIPVRLIIDKAGKVKHVHFLSAFPDQAKVITDALLQWRFKPYVVNGKPVEVETAMLFGQPAIEAAPVRRSAAPRS